MALYAKLVPEPMKAIASRIKILEYKHCMENPNDHKEISKLIPESAYKSTLVCPLCGAAVPARGLRPKATLKADDPDWELVFTCPACGLWTTFQVEGLSIEQIEALKGSPWANKLRHFNEFRRREVVPFQRRATRFHLFSVFVISFLTWMALIGNLNPPEIIWGLIVSLIVARLTYQFVAFDLPLWVLRPRKWRFFIELVIEFARQILVQNVTLSIRVLNPRLPIKPGIVAIPTALRDDIQLTILGSLMTLTPDTVTMDIDQRRGIIYVHWIDVQTTDPQAAQRLISSSLEEKISRWLNEERK